MINQDEHTVEIAAGATNVVRIGAPRGAILRRVAVVSAAFDVKVSSENSATPAARHVYHEALASTGMDEDTFTNPYLPAPAFYLVLKNNDASAQPFTVMVVFEEPPVSY